MPMPALYLLAAAEGDYPTFRDLTKPFVTQARETGIDIGQVNPDLKDYEMLRVTTLVNRPAFYLRQVRRGIFRNHEFSGWMLERAWKCYQGLTPEQKFVSGYTEEEILGEIRDLERIGNVLQRDQAVESAEKNLELFSISLLSRDVYREMPAALTYPEDEQILAQKISKRKRFVLDDIRKAIRLTILIGDTYNLEPLLEDAKELGISSEELWLDGI